MMVLLQEEKITTETRPCEDTGRRHLSTTQGERSQKKQTLTSRSQTSCLQNDEKINFFVKAILYFVMPALAK